MNEALKPVWKQFVETHNALIAILNEISDERMHWSPTPANWTPARIATHIAGGNVHYANLMETGESGENLAVGPHAKRAELLNLLDRSLDRVRTVLRDLPPERLRAVCATDWEPLGRVVKGDHDALWFAMQMVRHTAYHVGQLTYISQMA